MEAGEAIDVWIVERMLGRGGMSSVYHCHNRDLPDLHAAVKILTVSDARASQQLVDEAAALKRLDHPGIVQVWDISLLSDPPYMVMGLVEGERLNALLSRLSLTPRAAVGLAVQLADALAYAHQRGIWHRDIKPSNVLIQAGGRAMLVDFGIALMSDRAVMERLPPGTVYYAPPEWLDGEGLDATRWDLYSLGVILWEALTGERAFQLTRGDSAIELHDVVAEKRARGPLDPGGICIEPLRALVRALTDPAPSGALLTAAEVRNQLQGYLPDGLEAADLLAAVIPRSGISARLPQAEPDQRERWERPPPAESPSPDLAGLAPTAHPLAAGAERYPLLTRAEASPPEAITRARALTGPPRRRWRTSEALIAAGLTGFVLWWGLGPPLPIASLEASSTPAARRDRAARAELARTEAARSELARTQAHRAEEEAEWQRAQRAQAERNTERSAEIDRAEADRAKADRAEADRAEADRVEADHAAAERAAAERSAANAAWQHSQALRAERDAELRQEAARQEAARQEAARQEAARQEAARQEAAAALSGTIVFDGGVSSAQLRGTNGAIYAPGPVPAGDYQVLEVRFSSGLVIYPGWTLQVAEAQRLDVRCDSRFETCSF